MTHIRQTYEQARRSAFNNLPKVFKCHDDIESIKDALRMFRDNLIGRLPQKMEYRVEVVFGTLMMYLDSEVTNAK